MCCRCHLPDTCLECAKPIGWNHRYYCPNDGAFVQEQDCCQEDQCRNEREYWRS